MERVFRKMCHGVEQNLAKSAPTADSNADAWMLSLSHATKITEVWKTYGKNIDTDILSSFWGFSLLYSYRTAKNITGDPLEHLPSEVVPHIRAATTTNCCLGKAPPQTYRNSSLNLNNTCQSGQSSPTLQKMIAMYHPPSMTFDG